MKNLNLFLALSAVAIVTACKTSPTASENKTDSTKSIVVHAVQFPPLPAIGKIGDSPVLLGGFSGLEFQDERKGALIFKAITDRGANGLAIEDHPTFGKNVRPFLFPDYSPWLVEFELRGDKLVVTKKENFYSEDGSKKISGLPPVARTAKNADMHEAGFHNGKLLAADPLGFDVEGFCTDRRSRYWIAEEYYPSVAIFDVNRKLTKRLTPGNGLPEALSKRKINRGLEGLTCTQDYVYAMEQSPLKLADAQNKQVVRIIKISLASNTAESQFAYVLDDESADKIGDITNDDAGNFYVIEQNGKTGAKAVQKIYKIQLSDFSSLNLKDNPENWPIEMAKKKGVPKVLVADLSGTETNQYEKLEGIAFYNNRLYIMTDNDFGLDGDSGDPERPYVSSAKTSRLLWFDIPQDVLNPQPK